METKTGFYGDFGGAYIPEILKPVFDEISRGFNEIKKDKAFLDDYAYYLKHFVGRPTPLMYAENSTKKLGGAKIFLKLEGLANTGAHKINNALGQALLAKKLGKRKIIAETGAGQHGVATATACARLGLDCEIYMGEVDCERQKTNVYRMELLGAKVVPVKSGTRTLKDAINEALRDWSSSVTSTH